MTHIAMLLSNPFRPDPRVFKEAISLSEAGYQISIVCWDRMAELESYEKYSEYVEVIRIRNIPSSYGAGVKQIAKLPLFWREAIRKIIPLKPDVLHCHDLDTLYIGWRLKQLIRCKLLYDAHEDYPVLMAQYLPSPLVRALNNWERYLIRDVDYMITVSPLIVQKYAAFSRCPIQSVQNFQPAESFNSITPEMITAERLSLGLNLEDYLVVYIGGFSLNRLLLPLIEAVSGLPDVQLILWGDGQQKAAIQKAIRNIPNIRYLGWASSKNVPLYTSLADVIYYGIKPDYPFSSPNTLSNAMLAGCPILVTRVGDLGQIVEETGCGILLNEVTVGTIQNALEILRDPTLRQRLGQAGRETAKKQYNWENEAQKLLAVYENLI